MWITVGASVFVGVMSVIPFVLAGQYKLSDNIPIGVAWWIGGFIISYLVLNLILSKLLVLFNAVIYFYVFIST